VRSAAHSIDNRVEEFAAHVMAQDAAGTGLLAIGAEQTLFHWKNGTWALYPE
jgi:hypothetical protein